MRKVLLLGATIGAALLTGIASGPSGSAWARVRIPRVRERRSRPGRKRHAACRLGQGVTPTTPRSMPRAGPAGGQPSSPGSASAAGPGAVVAADGTLRAFVPGSIRAGDTGPAIGIHTLTSPASGGRWTLAPEAWAGGAANQRDVNAVVSKDGEPVTAVGGGGAVFFRGVANGGSPTILPPTPYSYDPEVAAEAGTGAITALWFVNQGGRQGIVDAVGVSKGVAEVPWQGIRRHPGWDLRSDRRAGDVRRARLADRSQVREVRRRSRAPPRRTPASPPSTSPPAPRGRSGSRGSIRDGSLHAARTNKAASRLGAVQGCQAARGIADVLRAS